MTMRGLLPCAAHFVKVVQEISKMKYPCNTMQGFDQPFAATGYLTLMLESHAKTVDGLCVNTLDYQEGQALAAAVLAANATAGRNNSTGNGTSTTVNTVEKKKDGLSRVELAFVVALVVACGCVLIAAVLWYLRRGQFSIHSRVTKVKQPSPSCVLNALTDCFAFFFFFQISHRGR